ncbi:hypothetical protein [Terrimonas alba]|uniref:hypothetical protein n=1 Tax=Terrimonas alba TaxID=3349636 RepID=UPI0035F221D1
MQKIIVHIKDQKKLAFTKELLKSFSFLEVEEINVKAGSKKKAPKTRQQELVNAFKEVKSSLEGKRKLKSFEKLLKELS